MAVLTLRQAVKHINGGLEALPDKRRPIGPKTLKKLAQTGAVDALPIGNTWTYSSESLDRWLQNYGRGPTFPQDGAA